MMNNQQAKRETMIVGNISVTSIQTAAVSYSTPAHNEVDWSRKTPSRFGSHRTGLNEGQKACHQNGRACTVAGD
jgi:hypothetical protein